MTIAFDTHEFIKELKIVGVSEPQAEAQAKALVKIIENELATKQDVKELEAVSKQIAKEHEESTRLEIERIRREIKELEVTLRREMKELELSLKLEIEKCRANTVTDLVKWMGGMFIAQTGVMIALVKLFLLH